MSKSKSDRTRSSNSAIAQMAKLVRHIRTALGETQPDFAKRLGTTQSSVSRWELGLAAPGGEFTPLIIQLGASTKSLGVGASTIEMGIPVIGAASNGQSLLNGEWPVSDHKFCFVHDNPYDQNDCRAFLVEDDHATELGYPKGTMVVGVMVDKVARKLRAGDHVVVQRPVNDHPTLLETRVEVLAKQDLNLHHIIYAVFSAMVARSLN